MSCYVDIHCLDCRKRVQIASRTGDSLRVTNYKLGDPDEQTHLERFLAAHLGHRLVTHTEYAEIIEQTEDGEVWAYEFERED
jgi:hypothetical protein